FTENDVEQGSNLSFSDQSLHSEQNIPEEYSHRPNESPATRSTILETAKSNSTTPYDSVLFNEISPFTSDENFILADILERSVNAEQNIMLHLNDNQPTFSSVFTETTHNNNNQSGIMSSEFLVYHRPHRETSFNNFMLRNSQNFHSETSTDHD
ncbi:unnamed protein product, partial [Rotaria magnacalcarata]